MERQRVLISGMGGELGSLTASLLEDEPWVGELEGIDVDPPRRRLQRATFHRIQLSDRARVVETVTAFDPHVLIHLGVWEPNARASAHDAERLTNEAAVAIVGAAAECPSLEAVIVRSGIEIYGRQRGGLSRPDEDAPAHPTSPYGRMVAGIEAVAHDVARRTGVTVGAIRLAPVLGPHIPSPLGRLLRMPVVPFSVLADPPFAVLEAGDAARAIVTAAARRVSGPLNVVAPGAITALQAILRGRRVPLPLVGPEWALARQLTHIAGAPVPEHVIEVLHRGRLADGARAAEVLGFTPTLTSSQVIDRVYQWESVVRRPPRVAWEAAS